MCFCDFLSSNISFFRQNLLIKADARRFSLSRLIAGSLSPDSANQINLWTVAVSFFKQRTSICPALSVMFSGSTLLPLTWTQISDRRHWLAAQRRTQTTDKCRIERWFVLRRAPTCTQWLAVNSVCGAHTEVRTMWDDINNRKLPSWPRKYFSVGGISGPGSDLSSRNEQRWFFLLPSDCEDLTSKCVLTQLIFEFYLLTPGVKMLI